MAIAFDTETKPIKPGRLAPDMVCLSISFDVDDAEVVHVNDPACKTLVEHMLTCGEILVGQNVAYDMGVICEQWPEFMPLVFDAYDRDLVTDTKLRQILIDIAYDHYGGYQFTEVGGKETVEVNVKYKYNLADLAARHKYPTALDKDTWRLRYGELIDKPVIEWERGAVEYSEHDAKSTLWVYEMQQAEKYFLDDQFRQARAAWAFHLVSAYGIRTDRVMIDLQEKKIQTRIENALKSLESGGFVFKGKDNKWHKRTKKIQEYALSLVLPEGKKHKVTPTGKVKLDEDAIADYNDPVLTAYSELSLASKRLPYLEKLRDGVHTPIHTRFELAETGRSRSDKPNMQNWQTDPGERECFVPREGFVFCDIDYEGLELRTLAQVCIWTLDVEKDGVITTKGQSKLADALNQGRDPHNIMAAAILKISEEEANRRKKDKADKEFKRARDVAKIANFGLGGGLGPSALIYQARTKEGIILSMDEAKALITTWKETWPEISQYFNKINAEMVDAASVPQFRSRRFRGGASYTELCNTFFQGLGADATKHALYCLVKACYVGDGVLCGCRVVNYVHDEFVVEVPETAAQECADEIQRIVVAAAKEWLPDLPVTAVPDLARRWSKLAGIERDKDGNIIGVIEDETGIWEWAEAIEAGSKGYAA